MKTLGAACLMTDVCRHVGCFQVTQSHRKCGQHFLFVFVFHFRFLLDSLEKHLAEVRIRAGNRDRGQRWDGLFLPLVLGSLFPAAVGESAPTSLLTNASLGVCGELQSQFSNFHLVDGFHSAD